MPMSKNRARRLAQILVTHGIDSPIEALGAQSRALCTALSAGISVVVLSVTGADTYHHKPKPPLCPAHSGPLYIVGFSMAAAGCAPRGGH